MKKTTYIAIMAALAVAAMPLTVQARPHHSSSGAVIAGLAVGLGIGILSATASQPTTVVYQQPAQVVYQQPAPVTYQPAPVVYQQPQVVYQEPQVVYQPAPVVYQQPQIIYQNVPQVIYTPPSQTIIYREPVRYFPSYPNYYHRPNYNYRAPSYNYNPPPRPSTHRGTQAGPNYGPPPSSHRGNGLRRP